MSILSATILSGYSENKIVFPTPPTDISVSDNYFGIDVKDPYRSLENDTASATLQWVKEENALTRQYLSNIPFRNALRRRLTELNNYKKTGLPWKDNDGLYYFYQNNGLKNQSVLYRADNPEGKNATVFLDPNTLSTDGTVALTGVYQSGNGKYTAYTISRKGSDWTEIYVLDTKTGKLLDDHITWAKFTGASWQDDGFYYSAYPKPEAGKEFSNANENHQIYYHKIGTPQSADKLAYSDPQNPLHFHSAYVPDSEDYLFVIGGGEGLGSSIIYRSLKDENAQWTTIEPSQDFNIDVIGTKDDVLYAMSMKDAPKYQLVSWNLKNPAEGWTVVVPEQNEVLSGVQFAGDNLILTYMKDAADQVFIYDLAGNKMNEIQLPTYGSTGFSSSQKHPEVFYSFNSFVYPSARYSYDLSTQISTLLGSADIKGIDFNDYTTERVFYPSADGTMVPMFITYKKGLKRDGKNPVLLYGYGGFNISLTPGFSANRMAWLENGGVYAQPSLRGGGEYGALWHEAGIKQNKMNVFNDFISAAQYLIDHEYTSPEHLAILGGSNGGLLVGATVNLRPDLFKAAVPQVGVMDMMRYHKFTIGWNWASDYGTSDDSKEMAEYLLSYSPIHNIKDDGTTYPAILVTTADHDDRVVPAHSFKYAATLQASDTGNAPKLIRIDSNAGHGSGKPMSKIIDEYADIYSFIMYNLGVVPQEY